MVGLCRGLLRNADEAEDAAQQAFLAAHGAFLRGAEPKDPAAWLTTIARNECLARIRERMRRPLPVADADSTPSSADPVAEAARSADMAALWRAVRALAPQQREAMLLREFGGLSYDELAVALGVSLPAVESLLFRARTRLRLELKTVTAALSGAGWISTLRDLLVGGGAAKVAGVGIAASLLTGGVVASERVLTPPHTSRRQPVAAPPAVHQSLVAPAAVSPPTFAPRAIRQVDSRTTARRAPSVPSSLPTDDPARADDSAPTASDATDGSSGDDRTPVTETNDPSNASVAPDGGDGTAPSPETGTDGGSSGATSTTSNDEATGTTTDGDGSGDTSMTATESGGDGTPTGTTSGDVPDVSGG